MSPVIPAKLKPGDQLRIVAPSNSLGIMTDSIRHIATSRLEGLGFKVTFGGHVEEMDEFQSSSIESRIEDLQTAFADRAVKGVLTVIGGYNCNQLLRFLNWDLIRKNPKFFCGFSDTTALQNALLVKANLVTYSGPAYATFGQLKYFDFTLEHFRKCVMTSGPLRLAPSEAWSDDRWYLDQENRTLIPNQGWLTINPGQAEGKIVGANLQTLQLLHGTEYLPDLRDTIVFLEVDLESQIYHWDRDLLSLILQPGFEDVRGIIIGRFQRESKITPELLIKSIKTKQGLDHLPIIAGVDFGHTSPIITFPIGGTARISAGANGQLIEILNH